MRKIKEFYPTWYGMMRRCYNKENHNYYLYGGRGIYVCDEWHDFKKFNEWAISTIGHKTKYYTIDRIDNNGPYCPENCRWATSSEQQRNKRNSLIISAFGEKMSIIEWSEKTGLGVSTIRERLKRGWSFEQSVSINPGEIIHQPEKRICDRYYTIDGIEHNISDWCKIYGINRATVYGRLRKGVSIIDALTIPSEKKNRFVKS